MEREACVCDHGFERSDLCAEIIIIIIHVWSPIPVFCFLYSKILPVTKMRLNVCFNEMALFGLFAALIKGCSSYFHTAEMEVSPTAGDG